MQGVPPPRRGRALRSNPARRDSAAIPDAKKGATPDSENWNRLHIRTWTFLMDQRARVGKTC